MSVEVDVSMFSKADFSNPQEQCDLVMKGGITSGIVYPPVVLKLASEGKQGRKYRFRSVGGTSAGAISAAVTAAAEYGRENKGFQKFEELRQQLSTPDFLFNLFQPAEALAPLMYTLLDLAGKTPPQKEDISTNPQGVLQAIFEFVRPLAKRLPFGQILNKVVDTFLRRSHKVHKEGFWGIVVGFGVAAILTVTAALTFQLTDGDVELWGFVALLLVLGIPLALVGYYLGILLLGVIDVFESLTQKLPNDNLFGMCTGRSPTGKPAGMQSKEPVLTDWLSEQIDYISGLQENRPLTFGDLCKKPDINGQDVSINLKMATSNLSQNQPYTLPFGPEHLFLFNENEFKRLFPEKVVRQLVEAGKKAGEQNGRKKFKLPAKGGFYFLPDSDDLPIVVAMRMSLSFPLLISAIPLYTIKQSALPKEGELIIKEDLLQKNWFSDGGICSNFPIHFFDNWLPTHPTFAINLATSDDVDKNAENLSLDSLSVSQYTSQQTQKGGSRAASKQVPEQGRSTVYIWKAGDLDPAPEHINTRDKNKVKNSESLFKFAAQIFYTAQNYRDTMQSYLPGYRERIVQIRLNPDEGGLNLGMSKSTIEKVMQKGGEAGDRLNQDFNFEHHKWIRFRVLMGLLEENLTVLYEKALKEIDPNDLSEGDKFSTDQLIKNAQDRENPGQGYPYPYPSKEHAEKARDCAERMRLSVKNVWHPVDETGEPITPSLTDQQPLPKSLLRTTPEL